MKRVKEFILKSKKIYGILGAGMMLCICVLTANISYGMGQEQAAGYSKEYMSDYAIITFAYADSFSNEPFENALAYAENSCNLSYGK